jgi:hypothetical protein
MAIFPIVQFVLNSKGVYLMIERIFKKHGAAI